MGWLKKEAGSATLYLVAIRYMNWSIAWSLRTLGQKSGKAKDPVKTAIKMLI
jgi:hypothetical protein